MNNYRRLKIAIEGFTSDEIDDETIFKAMGQKVENAMRDCGWINIGHSIERPVEYLSAQRVFCAVWGWYSAGLTEEQAKQCIVDKTGMDIKEPEMRFVE